MRTVLVCVLTLVTACSITSGTTLLHYDFEDGVPNALLNGTNLENQIGTHDVSGNGWDMYVWNKAESPSFSSPGQTPTGHGLSAVFDGRRDGYCLCLAMTGWSPSTWTVEFAFKLDSLADWQTFIGRDGPTGIPGDLAGAFYIQKAFGTNNIRLNFATAGGGRRTYDSSFVPQVGVWYRLAVVGANGSVKMWLQQPNSTAWQSLSLVSSGTGDCTLHPGVWMFGRGWYDGAYTNYVVGNLDDIRISNVALTPNEFLPATVHK